MIIMSNVYDCKIVRLSSMIWATIVVLEARVGRVTNCRGNTPNMIMPSIIPANKSNIIPDHPHHHTQEMSASSSPFCPNFCSICWCLIFPRRSRADRPVSVCELWEPGHTELITAESCRLRNKNKSEHKFIVSPVEPVEPVDPDWKLLRIPSDHAIRGNVDVSQVVELENNWLNCSFLYS